MNIRCLIIDRNPIFSNKLGSFIKTFRGHFQVQTAANIPEAIKTLVSTDLSLILCEPFLAEFNTGLISCILDKKPTVSLIITGKYDSPPLKIFNTLSCIKGFITWPVVQPAELAGKVVISLGSLFFQGKVRKVNCTTFVQIFEKEYSDYTLRVINIMKKIEGLLFFKKGILIDAICGTILALEAAQWICSWENVDIELYNICPLRENRINLDMTSLILQCIKNQQAGEQPSFKTGIERSPKSTYKSVGGLAELFLKKAKKI